MPNAGSTSELYSDPTNSASTLGAPPAPPSDVPAPTQPVKVTEPVVTKARMADEDASGHIRDTSTEALRDGNSLGFRNLDDEKIPATKPDAPAQPEAPKEAQAAPTPAEPPKERVYAGKFKTIEDLEKGYGEAERAMHKAFEEKAALERQATAAATPPPPAVKTAEQLAAEKAESDRILAEFVNDPKGYIENQISAANQRTQIALAAQAASEAWRKSNADIAAYEFYVASEAYRLSQSDPELAKDPSALLERATANFREMAGKLRTEGAREALTTETRVINLANSNPTPSPTEQPVKAPLSADDAYSAHMAMLKDAERRSHRGLRR